MADADRLIAAQLAGAARRHAPYREPTEDEITTAVAELREIAGGRADLLAEQAGILIGFYEGRIGEVRAQAAAVFLMRAADGIAEPGEVAAMVGEWIGIGRQRAADARREPFGVKVAPKVTGKDLPPSR